MTVESGEKAELSIPNRLEKLKQSIQVAPWERENQTYKEKGENFFLLPLNEAQVWENIFETISLHLDSFSRKKLQKDLITPILETRTQIENLLKGSSPDASFDHPIGEYQRLRTSAEHFQKASEDPFFFDILSATENPQNTTNTEKMTAFVITIKSYFQEIAQKKHIAIPTQGIEKMEALVLKDSLEQKDAQEVKTFLGIGGDAQNAPLAVLLQKQSEMMTPQDKVRYGGYLISFASLLLSKLVDSGNISKEEAKTYLSQLVLEGNMTMQRASEVLTQIDKDVEASGEQFDLPESARERVNGQKLLLLQTGDSIDNRLAPLLNYLRTGKIQDAKQALELHQLLTDITADKGDFSKKNLDAVAKEITQKESTNRRDRMKGDRSLSEENIHLDQKYLSGFEQQFSQMALYEMAIGAQAMLKNSEYAPGTERFRKEIEHELLEGVGFQIINGKVTAPDGFNYKDAGNVAKKVLTPGGLAVFLGLQYGGLMTFLFNMLIFLQTRDPGNLAYAAAGIGAMYAGAQILTKNTVDSLFHPENKVFNKLQSLVGTPEQKYLYLYATYPQLFSCINLGDQGQKAFNNAIQQETTAQNSNEQAKRTEKGTDYTKKPLSNALNKMSMEEYAKQFSGMFRGEAAQKKFGELGKGITGKDYPAQYEDRSVTMSDIHDAIRWLYKENIPNDRLYEASIIAGKLSIKTLAKEQIPTSKS